MQEHEHTTAMAISIDLHFLASTLKHRGTQQYAGSSGSREQGHSNVAEADLLLPLLCNCLLTSRRSAGITVLQRFQRGAGKAVVTPVYPNQPATCS